MMRVLVRGPAASPVTLELCPHATCAQLHARVALLPAAPAAFALAHAGRALPADARTLAAAGLCSPALLSVLPRLAGGGTANKNQMDPAFQALADQYNVQKLVCRCCYATTHCKAKTCRKRKCGRSAKLRPKKIARK